MRTDDDLIGDHERFLVETIHALRLQYEAAVKPYMDRLVYLRNIRPAPRFVVTFEQLQELQARDLVPRA